MSRRSQGFTLVEALVTLMLVATVSTLLWQALGLLARWERGVLQQRLDGGETRLRRAWVEQAIWGSVAGANGDAFRFVGDERRLRTYTSAPPWPATLGPDAMELSVHGIANGGGEVRAIRLSDGEVFVLWRWSADDGGGPPALSYLDAQGRWQSSWPPQIEGGLSSAAQQLELPRAVRLSGPKLPVLVSVQATRNPMLQRRVIESPEGRS